MHELSIVQAIVEQVEKEVAASGHSGRVTRLELVIGRLSGVCSDSIRFAFELLAPDTILAGAEIAIAEPKAMAACRQCGAHSPIDELSAACPACGGRDVTIEGGQELLLQSVELEDD